MTIKIELSSGKHAIVDDDDFEKIRMHKWSATKNGNTYYASASLSLRNGKKKKLYMHRLLIKIPNGFVVDHIDGDGLNNTKANLRVCTRSQNLMNRSKNKNNTTGYKGIWRNSKNTFCAFIVKNRKRQYVGSFKTAEQAAKAYDDAVRKHFGSFGRTNF